MESNTFIKSKKAYKLWLILSAVILFTIFLVTISQILSLQKSGDKINTNLNETIRLDALSKNVKKCEIAYLNDELTDSLLSLIENDNSRILDALNLSDSSSVAFNKTHASLFTTLKTLSSSSNYSKKEILSLFENVDSAKNNMLQVHNAALSEDSKKFVAYNKETPYIFIAMTSVALIILLISFYKIYLDRKEISQKSNILDAILDNTNDIANFYTPVYDSNNKVINFKIKHASKANISISDYKYEDMIGKTITEVFPFIEPSGILDQFITAFETQTYFEKTKIVPINDEEHHFKERFIPIKNGLQVIITDYTDLVQKQEELAEKNRELSIKNELLSEAEVMAKLGSYIWYMKDDVTIMSDNVFRILGFEPQSFDMSAAKFREFTHPDDLDMYDQQVSDAFSQNKPIEFIFRILTTDNTIKYIYTNGVMSEDEDVQVMLGIIQDVSERMANEIMLREQNIDLMSRNTELDSFNRVASHDLQEPLRKIQMFMSRIEDSEDTELSENGQRYFEKIKDATVRMRTLIKNLLAFSRVDNKDYEFELIDLETIIGTVLEDFSEKITKKEVRIERGKLPKINAIPFLMEQLFTNLISNSIKYSNTNVDSKIIIESKKIHSKQIPLVFIKTHAYYHQIKIIDNGIGFNPENSEKIFGLFQRLHEKNEYSGTGIGLAICQKIVQKHYGYINATSVPNEGSVFTVYLPSGKLKKLTSIIN